jgi:hypothetical protein
MSVDGLPDTPTANAHAYLVKIRDEMIRLFGIGRDEAEGRIRRQWADQAGFHEDELLRELPDYWAKWIYYGQVKFWLYDEESLPPSPYP